MAWLGIDLGGTKMAFGVFNEQGELLFKNVLFLEKSTGQEVSDMLINETLELIRNNLWPINGIGISIPGIYHIKTGTVWAPNISGWENFPLLAALNKAVPNIPVYIDSDRACCILGEAWLGKARGCNNVVFLTVGTGIGAGILVDGRILRGANDIAGAIGWLAIKKPFEQKYISCGCFEYGASGKGIARLTNDFLAENKNYSGTLNKIPPELITGELVFEAYAKGDEIADKVIAACIEDWGMAVANLVSLFNPEKIIFGGGVFGPAIPLIPKIREEAAKWAQPVSMKEVIFEPSALGEDAALFGAASLSLQNIFS